VETRAQLDQLIASGCTEAQGLLFSPARRRIEVPRLLAGWPSAPRDVPPGVETASGETVPQYMISVGSD
jgi:EAL domain-containing protein (putative c-di-GMP-specific phosphodiesterase class I)